MPNTLVLIDRPFLDPNPFDAEPSDPIVLAPAALTPLSQQAARQLRRLLPLRGNPDGTVRLQTPGLDKEITALREWRETKPAHAPWNWKPASRDKGARCARHGGVLLFAAPPAVLRDWAVEVYDLADCYYNGQSNTEFLWPDGEVQLWEQYHRMVSAATTARRDLLAVPPADRPPRDVRELVWSLSVKYQRRMIP